MLRTVLLTSRYFSAKVNCIAFPNVQFLALKEKLTTFQNVAGTFVSNVDAVLSATRNTWKVLKVGFWSILFIGYPAFLTIVGKMAEEGFKLVSPAFKNGEKIPRKFTWEGSEHQHDLSPPLEWYNVPEGTESLALIMEDPDAPDPDDPVNPWVHWVLINIPPTLKGLPAGFSAKNAPEGSEYAEIQEGWNDWKVPGYRGPNPPAKTHRFVFRLYALDTKLNLGHKVKKEKVEDAIAGHVLGEAELVGVYSKDKYITGRQTYIPPGEPQGCGQGRADVIKPSHHSHHRTPTNRPAVVHN